MVQNLHSHQEDFSSALVTGGHWRWRPGSAEDRLAAGEHVQSDAGVWWELCASFAHAFVWSGEDAQVCLL